MHIYRHVDIMMTSDIARVTMAGVSLLAERPLFVLSIVVDSNKIASHWSI